VPPAASSLPASAADSWPHSPKPVNHLAAPLLSSSYLGQKASGQLGGLQMLRRIGRVEIDEKSMRLSVDGAAIPVEPLVFRLILYLSDNKDRVVSKSELVDTLWEGRAVSDSALTRAVSLARRALRTPGLPNPIRAVYGTGYQLQDGETDTRSESSSGREAKLAAPAHRFIGREAELSNFGRALAALGNGSGGVFLIRGEAGIGKSRLAEEAIQRAHAMGIPARIGRCSESGGAPSFWPWIQILRQEIEHRGTPEAKEFGELTTRRLNRLVKFADLRPAERSISLLPSTAGDRFSLFDSVSQFLKVRCAQGPAVLVIDDLHCADRESLALLQFITSEVPRAGLLVVAAYREAELPSFERQVVAEIANLSAASAAAKCSARSPPFFASSTASTKAFSAFP
jgi:DNA-binding winged helix-turn-helix (wHTH) protein